MDKFSEGKPNPHPQKVKVQTNNMTMTFIPHLDELIEAYDKAETMDEIERLSKEIEKIVYDDAAWVNGWKEPYLRGAYQRYIKWPKDYNVAQARYLQEFFLMWIDQDEKKAVEEARRSGKTFPPMIIKAEKFRQQ